MALETDEPESKDTLPESWYSLAVPDSAARSRRRANRRKKDDPSRRRSPPSVAHFSLFLVCVLFGFALMIQLRTQNTLRQEASGQSQTDLATIAGDLYDSNTALRQEVDKLRAQQSNVDQSYDPGKQADVASEEARLEAFNGVVEVTGPGIQLTIDAALRPVDVEDMLNEIRNAGGEAIAIGGERVVFNTAIGGNAGRITVNGVTIAMPVVFDATGSPDVLEPALARKGGMVSYLRTAYPNARITLTRQDSLILPAYSSPLPIRPAS